MYVNQAKGTKGKGINFDQRKVERSFRPGKANMVIFHIIVFADTVKRMVTTLMTALRKGTCETTIGTMFLWL